MTKIIISLLLLFFFSEPLGAQVKISSPKNTFAAEVLNIQSKNPLFLMEGDHIEMLFILENKSAKEITGQVSFELWDAKRKTPVDGWFQNIFPAQYFTIEKGKMFPLRFPIQVPYSFNQTLAWKLTANAGGIKKTQEAKIPIIPIRPLVTKKLPLLVNNDTTQQITFSNLLANESETLTSMALSTEYAQNPLFYALQALPNLMNYPDNTASETFCRLLGYCLAWFSTEKYPVTYAAFAQKNAKNWETDSIVKQSELLLKKLQGYQSKEGSFSWLKGGIPDKMLTSYIISGFKQLKTMGALPKSIAKKIKPFLAKENPAQLPNDTYFPGFNTNNSLKKDLDSILFNKQINGWRNNQETAEACYWIMLNGKDYILNKPQFTLQLGDPSEPKPLFYNLSNSSFTNFTIDGNDIIPELGKIKLEVKSSNEKKHQPAENSYGALYWQYFEQVGKIDESGLDIQINKAFFKEIKTGNQIKRVLLNDGEELKKGDNVISVVTVSTEQDQQYLILKDQFSPALKQHSSTNEKENMNTTHIKKITTATNKQWYISQLKAGITVFEETYLLEFTGQFHTGMASIEKSQVPGNISYANGIRFSVVE